MRKNAPLNSEASRTGSGMRLPREGNSADVARHSTEPQIARLESELAGVARLIAALLTQLRYDEAELAELDVRAKKLREQVAAAKEPDRQARLDSLSRFESGRQL